MEIDRRRFLVGSVVALANAAAFGRCAASAAPARFASACRREDGTYAIALLDAAGHIVEELPLTARAHDVAWSKSTSVAVAFARQPGRFAVAFSPAGQRSPFLFAPPDNRAFFGHGIFSPDGKLLYATENDLDEGGGRIGIYDAGGAFARIGELPSGGIGPHELVLLDDGRTLVIANGGYETLPETGRQPIDIAGIRPSLVFMDRITGEVRASHELPDALHPLSIRHLAVDRRGSVWFGGQWEGSPDATPEIIGSASLDRPLTLLAPPAPLGPSLKGYIGSVAVSRDGETLAAAAPRAGRTLLIDTQSGTLRSEVLVPDGCGLAATGDGLFVSSGHGRLILHRDNVPDATIADLPGLAFDNHLRWLASS